MARNNMWSEVALVSVSPIDGDEREFYTITDSIDFKIGAKDVDFKPNLAGGRLDNFQPMEETEITMKVYPTEMGGSNGVFDFFCANTSDTTDPLSFTIDRGRTKYRVVFLVTEDTSVSSAVSEVSSSPAARLTAENGYLVEATPEEFTPDSGWSWNVRFKFPPFQKDGTGNITGESTNGDESLPAIDSYTSS
ncbi:MAG: hypothetical protein ACOCZ5_00660 [bacterium]